MSLKFRHLPLESQSPKPAIIMMHGIGSNMDDLFSFASVFAGKFEVFSLQAPMPYFGMGWAWYNIDWTDDGPKIEYSEVVEAREKVVSFIEEAIPNYNLDKDRIYLLGFSQGCILSYAISLKHPHLIAGVAGLSGYLLEDSYKELQNTDALSGLKYFISHGIFDEVIPIERAQKSIEKLKTLPIEITYKEYAMPHSINEECLNDMLNWFRDK